MLAMQQRHTRKYRFKKNLVEHGPGEYACDLFEDNSFLNVGIPSDGKFAVVGPHAHDRKWWAEVEVEDGKIVKVT